MWWFWLKVHAANPSGTEWTSDCNPGKKLPNSCFHQNPRRREKQHTLTIWQCFFSFSVFCKVTQMLKRISFSVHSLLPRILTQFMDYNYKPESETHRNWRQQLFSNPGLTIQCYQTQKAITAYRTFKPGKCKNQRQRQIKAAPQYPAWNANPTFVTANYW